MLVFWGVDFRGLGRGFEFRMLHMRGALVFRASAASVFGMLTIACAVSLALSSTNLGKSRAEAKSSACCALRFGCNGCRRCLRR